MKIKKLGALLVSVALCAGMAAPAFAYGGEPVEEVEQPVLTSTTDEEDAVTVTDEENGALTPEGNLTLVDDYHTDYSDGSGQQFITLVSKSGNTFYLVIDRNSKGAQTLFIIFIGIVLLIKGSTDRGQHSRGRGGGSGLPQQGSKLFRRDLCGPHHLVDLGGILLLNAPLQNLDTIVQFDAAFLLFCQHRPQLIRFFAHKTPPIILKAVRTRRDASPSRTNECLRT